MRVIQAKHKKAPLGDPSTLYRPESKKSGTEAFRNYEMNCQTETCRQTYRAMHENQSVEFVHERQRKWLKFDHAEMTIMEALTLLDDLVDTSDPDFDLPNSYHAFLTADKIRECHPDKRWLQLTGLIHDIGKIMALWGEPQWAVVGDTFPVGCQFDKSCVFHEFFSLNPDTKNPAYSTETGIYAKNCGLDNVTMSWGHDEYMYQLLKHNKTTLPEEALYIIRYHSFYPWHSSGGYQHLCDERDQRMLLLVKEFSSYDLYTKHSDLPDQNELKAYYQQLIDEYIPGVLKW